MKALLLAFYAVGFVPAFASSTILASSTVKVFEKRDLTDAFPYLRNGTLYYYPIGTPDSPNTSSIVFYLPNGSSEPIVVSRSVLGINALLRNESTMGVDGDYVEHLPELLGRLDTQNPMIGEKLLGQMKRGPWTKIDPSIRTLLEKLVDPPFYVVTGNTWEVRFLTMNSDGGFMYWKYTGLLHPLKVTETRSIVLIENPAKEFTAPLLREAMGRKKTLERPSGDIP